MSGFGMRRDPFNPNVWQMHYGIDFAAPTGTPIFATGNGVVARIEHKANGYGLNVVVDHGFGYKTLYAHMSSIATTVGKKVKRGEIIGFVGSTGHSTAPHLHYEIFKNDTRVNPSSYCSNMTTEEYKSIIIAANGTMSFAPKNSRKRKRR
jgi:murein DD-endopeptidase MepM/ murein hydrolase activator NlpD